MSDESLELETTLVHKLKIWPSKYSSRKIKIGKMCCTSKKRLKKMSRHRSVRFFRTAHIQSCQMMKSLNDLTCTCYVSQVLHCFPCMMIIKVVPMKFLSCLSIFAQYLINGSHTIFMNNDQTLFTLSP